MKIKYCILPFTLAVAVIISIWLSSSIWINPAHYDRSSQKVSTPTTQIDAKPISSVYAPTQVLETTAKGQQYILTSQTVNLMSVIGDKMKDYQNAQMKQLKSNAHDYMQLLRKHNTLMLNYPSSLNLRVVSKYFNGQLDHLSNVTVNRIVIPFDTSNNFYLLNDGKQQIYRVHVKQSNAKDIKQLIRDNVNKIPVKMEMRGSAPFINFYRGVKMPQYGYLTSKVSQNYYVTRLLTDSQDVSVKRHRNSIVYNDDTSRQITFSNDGEVNFFDSHPGAISTSATQFLTDAYNKIAKISTGDNLANIRFFNYDAKKSKVIYRKYVEGFPIFNKDQDQYGAIQMRLVDNTSLKYNFSLKTLQIPVPTGRKDVKLKTTDQVMDSLRARGYNPDKIQSIELGYQWSNIKSSDILIVLEPTWFVQYNGRFLDYNQMLTKNLQ